MKINKRFRRIVSPYYQKLKKLVHRGDTIFLVYSMGKVGSASIYTSLKNQKPYSDIFHLHFLSKNWLDKLLPKEHESFHSNIKLGNDILKFIKKNPTKRIKIITLVREPVMRGISDIFQNWEHLYDNIEEVDNKELQKRVEQIGHEYTLNWFDTEFLEYTKIDIYQLPFNKELGYAIYNYDNMDILCIKLESLNEIGSRAMSEFIGEEFNLISANVSAQKKTRDQYAFLKENVRIEKSKITELYKSKFMRHFYTPTEIDNFSRKWSRDI